MLNQLMNLMWYGIKKYKNDFANNLEKFLFLYLLFLLKYACISHVFIIRMLFSENTDSGRIIWSNTYCESDSKEPIKL
jgi:hypothetical protein